VQDKDSERRVISCLLNCDTEEPLINGLQLLRPSDFTEPLHRRMFETVSTLYTRGVKPTYAELTKEFMLSGQRTIEEIKEMAYIAEQFIDEANIGHWINLVKNATKRRNLGNVARTIAASLQDGVKTETIIQQLSDQITEIANDDVVQIETGGDLAESGMGLVEEKVMKYREILERGEKVRMLEGTPTGFYSLDRVTFGYKPGDLIIIGAETGHGKTAFALQTAACIAVEHQEPLLYVNTEMSRKQIVLRLGSVLSGESGTNIRIGNLTSDQLSKVLQGYTRLGNSGFYLLNDYALTANRLELYTRKMKIQKNIKVVIVDYIGRMDKYDRDQAEWQRLEQLVKAQKILAQDLGIAVICLVQLNQDGNLQGAKRMKNECDVMLKLLPLDTDEKTGKHKVKAFENYPDATYELCVDKNRDNMTCRIPLMFEKEIQRFSEARSINDAWAAVGKVV
jgi:replicative DNA helicase